MAHGRYMLINIYIGLIYIHIISVCTHEFVLGDMSCESAKTDFLVNLFISFFNFFMDSCSYYYVLYSLILRLQRVRIYYIFLKFAITLAEFFTVWCKNNCKASVHEFIKIYKSIKCLWRITLFKSIKGEKEIVPVEKIKSKSDLYS